LKSTVITQIARRASTGAMGDAPVAPLIKIYFVKQQSYLT
jgi:hypothetical protein